MAKVAIGSGGVKLSLSEKHLSSLKSREKKKSVDVSPDELFHDEVKEIGQYAKINRRVKNKLRHEGRGFGRLLSFKEIGEVEKRMIESGQDINPRYYKESKMRTGAGVAERMRRLYKVMKGFIEQKGFFKMDMLLKDQIMRDRITDSPKYFERAIYEDLRKLREKKVVYRRGKVHYLMGAGTEPKMKKSGKENPEDYDQRAAQIVEALVKEKIGGRPSIPEHITVDVSVTFKFNFK